MKRKNKRMRKGQKMMIYFSILIMLFIVLIILLFNMDKLEKGNTKEKATDTIQETTEGVTEEPTTIDNTIHKVTFIAVGDNLVSDSVTHCGLQPDGSYDFSALYAEMKADFQKADLAVINQETILGGSEFAYTGYPNFNSPNEVGDAIIDAGFDVVLQASNHSYDMGVKGIENCMKYWKKHKNEVTMIGLNKNEKQKEKITVIEKNGIKIALLNYTYSLNGYTLPKGKEYLVNLIDEEKIMSDITKAEEMADFTIIFPHWGVEYSYEPTDEQKDLAMKMTQAGADLIVGAHPHVLETIEWVTAANGNKSLCYYSLGNYLSSQDRAPRMLGGMAKLTIVKKGDEVYIKKNAGVVPIVTHFIWGEGRLTKTYRLTDYTDNLAAVHSVKSCDNTFSVKMLKDLAKQVVGDWIVK